MATALQIAANRRNAKKSTGPRTAEGKKQASLSAVKHGMTAQTVVLPHESGTDYEEIRAALIKDYAPATTQELMLVDQIAIGYWRTIRARRFEVAMFDNQLRTKKHEHGKDTKPNSRDDEGCAVILQVTDPNDLKNYFRYDGTISRDYYRAIATLEKMQAARRREEDRQERKARQAAKDLDRIINNPDPDTVAEISSEPPLPRQTFETEPVHSIGFVSYYSPLDTGDPHENGDSLS
jgi:hypothetical protein